jgi:hypothetical protein
MGEHRGEREEERVRRREKRRKNILVFDSSFFSLLGKALYLKTRWMSPVISSFSSFALFFPLFGPNVYHLSTGPKEKINKYKTKKKAICLQIILCCTT